MEVKTLESYFGSEWHDQDWAKSFLEEHKHMLNIAWSKTSDDSRDNDESIDMPYGLKKYTIADWKVIL